MGWLTALRCPIGAVNEIKKWIKHAFEQCDRVFEMAGGVLTEREREAP